MILLASMLTVAGMAGAAGDGRPDVRWRGFNLLGMFVKGHSPGHFVEEDFRLINEWGFNFVRLPMDYRFWIKDGDWERIDVEKVAPVDQAVAYGKAHRIHVQLCFHRAPGYTVAKPPEARDLFSDAEALRVCARHWAFFARRYKGIPSSELSFNLFNEPGDQTEEAYEKVASALVAAIRAEDPSRFIVADGLKWGSRPVPALYGLGIGQAMRGYTPMSVSHYLASWVGTPSEPPEWPLPPLAKSPLYGPMKKPWDTPLVIADVPAGRIALELDVMSGPCTYRVEANGKTVLERELVPSVDDPANWTNAVYKTEWNITQGRYLGTLEAALPDGAKRLAVSIPKGDWAGVRSLTLTAPDGRAARLKFGQDWGKTNAVWRFAGFGEGFLPPEGKLDGTAYLNKAVFDAAKDASDKGVFVMVGEFGAFQHTPHDLTLRWLEDNLKIWKANGWGWAMWEFRGSFGVMDSKRKDVAYEEFNGHQLDRKMLQLLQKY
jgi:aryl-phospho-beta-D-glucosidase BglC (GH1 family)